MLCSVILGWWHAAAVQFGWEPWSPEAAQRISQEAPAAFTKTLKTVQLMAHIESANVTTQYLLSARKGMMHIAPAELQPWPHPEVLNWVGKLWLRRWGAGLINWLLCCK